MEYSDPLREMMRSTPAVVIVTATPNGFNAAGTLNAPSSTTSGSSVAQDSLNDPSPAASTSSDVHADASSDAPALETPKSSRKRAAKNRGRVVKVLKTSEKQYISDDCNASKLSMEKARQSLPRKHDMKLPLSVLIPHPFYREIDPAYVQQINELLEQKLFDLKRTTFTVCEDPASGKYFVLNGNHRVTSLTEKYGSNCQYEFDCIVYGPLTNEQKFAICLALTKPAMSLEMRFLDQVNIFRKYRRARGLQRSTKIYDDQLDLGSWLVGKPNKFAIEISQWSEEDYSVVASYVSEFQNNKISEHPEKKYIHYSNQTEDGKLPDLKAGTFWSCIMKGCKIDKNYTLSLLKKQSNDSYLTLHEVKEGVKHQPKFLLRLKRMGIVYETLEEASKDLCDGIVYTDTQLMNAINNRTHLAHIGLDGVICSIPNLKRKIQLALGTSSIHTIRHRIIDFKVDEFTSDLHFSKMVVISMEFIDAVTLLKIIASIDSNSTIVILGSFDSDEVCKALNCTRPTLSSFVMLEERFYDEAVSELYNNILQVTIFVKQNNIMVPLDIAFEYNFYKLPLNKVMSPTSLKMLLAVAASSYHQATSNFRFVLPSLTKLDQLWQCFSQIKSGGETKFYVHGEEHRIRFLGYIDKEENSNVSPAASPAITYPTSPITAATADLPATFIPDAAQSNDSSLNNSPSSQNSSPVL